MNTPYVGRFAPSPTGPLHFGSLVAAVGSYLDARAHGGAWLVRIEDLDPPREVPGASDLILRTLAAYGFEWDGAVLYQHTRQQAYEAALDALARAGRLYPCACTRSEIAESNSSGALVYPGTCRNGLPPGKVARAWRVRVEVREVEFDDALQGRVAQNLAREVGDFVLKRADGLYAYQLAVVVDDAMQGITHVVRGMDLLDSTPRQICLQQQLGLPNPCYAHLPLVTNAAGEKLSKQTRAAALDLAQPSPVLWQALSFLGQQPPAELRHADLAELWAWAHQHWRLSGVPRVGKVA